MSEPVSILKDIARQQRKRVYRSNHFDANVCTSPFDRERPWEILALPGDMFRHKLNIAFRGHRITLHANGEFVRVTVNESLALEVCSVNRKDKVFQLERIFIEIPSFPEYPVFSKASHSGLRPFLESSTLRQVMSKIRPTLDESIHFYRNGVVAYVKRGSKEEVTSVVETLCDFVEQAQSDS